MIAAPIAPHEAGRQAVREAVARQAGPGSNFFVIHVATPVEHCEKTDRRGVYAQAREGILKGLSGVDEDFEVPKDANLTVDLTENSIPQVVHSELLFWSSTMPLIHSCCRHRVVTRDVGSFIVGCKIRMDNIRRMERGTGSPIVIWCDVCTRISSGYFDGANTVVLLWSGFDEPSFRRPMSA